MFAPTQKLNILIYVGPGASATCISQAQHTLRALLSPSYAVGPVSLQALRTEPWQLACALLVFPGGADNPYCASLGGSAAHDGTKKIADYVRRGGKYLGLCAGGYFGCGRCEFEVGNPELEVVGARELRFFPGTCRGGVFQGFRYGSEDGARAARIRPVKTLPSEDGDGKEKTEVSDTLRCYCNGGGVFVDAAGLKDRGVEVLASYEGELDVDGGDGEAAAVHCKVGEGSAILMGPHPEFDASLLPRQPQLPQYDNLLRCLEEDDDKRLRFLASCLRRLGLTVNKETEAVPAPTELHLSALKPESVSELLQDLTQLFSKDDAVTCDLLKDQTDIFRFITPSQLPALNAEPARSKSAQVKAILTYESPSLPLPSPETTPFFSHPTYFASLAAYRAREFQAATTWGSPLLYASVLPSTNTILDKNPRLLSSLPSGFTVSTTTQTSGRGRGDNVWVSPQGCLMFSVVVNHPVHLTASRPLVFLQYLTAIAVAEGVKSYEPESVYGAMPVKLKWPNDIYIRKIGNGKKEAKRDEYVKIGGILSSCNHLGGNYQVVLGIGINTTNEKPTTSLNAVLEDLLASCNTTRVVGDRDARFPMSPAALSCLSSSLGTVSLSGITTSIKTGQAAEAEATTARTIRKIKPYEPEVLLARILTRLEVLYGRFLSGGFSPDLEERYYAHWLHSGQEVSIVLDDLAGLQDLPSSSSSSQKSNRTVLRAGDEERAEPRKKLRQRSMKAVVEGITVDWGMLRVRELGTNKMWALQSDENSFDYWKGLIRRKM